MPLAPFQLLLWCWILVNGLVCVLRPCGPFKWSFLNIWPFLLPPQPPLVFIARSYGDLSSRHWNPGLCGLAWGWDHSLSRYPSQFLFNTCECGTAHDGSATVAPSPCHTSSPHLSAPPTHLNECGFFKSLVLRLPYSSIFWKFWVLFVLRSSCNSFCDCTRRWSMSTYTSTLTGCLWKGQFPVNVLW